MLSVSLHENSVPFTSDELYRAILINILRKIFFGDERAAALSLKRKKEYTLD